MAPLLSVTRLSSSSLVQPSATEEESCCWISQDTFFGKHWKGNVNAQIAGMDPRARAFAFFQVCQWRQIRHDVSFFKGDWLDLLEALADGFDVSDAYQGRTPLHLFLEHYPYAIADSKDIDRIQRIFRLENAQESSRSLEAWLLTSDSRGSTPLHVACNRPVSAPNALRWIVRMGNVCPQAWLVANVSEGNTPLHILWHPQDSPSFNIYTDPINDWTDLIESVFADDPSLLALALSRTNLAGQTPMQLYCQSSFAKLQVVGAMIHTAKGQGCFDSVAFSYLAHKAHEFSSQEWMELVYVLQKYDLLDLSMTQTVGGRGIFASVMESWYRKRICPSAIDPVAAIWSKLSESSMHELATRNHYHLFHILLARPVHDGSTRLFWDMVRVSQNVDAVVGQAELLQLVASHQSMDFLYHWIRSLCPSSIGRLFQRKTDIARNERIMHVYG